MPSSTTTVAGEPPLHRAARTGDHDAIRALVAAGADLGEVFDYTLDAGAYRKPATPLMIAAGSGDGASLATVELLLDLGADPTTLLSEAEGGSGELRYAVSAATYAAVGLDPRFTTGDARHGGGDRLASLLAAGAPLPPDPEEAHSVLCSAALIGAPDRIALLLDYGLNANGYYDEAKAREEGRAHAETYARMKAGDPEALAELPEAFREMIPMMAQFEPTMPEDEEASVESESSPRPSGYEIPLFCAAASGSVECVELLLKAGADPLAQDDLDQSALDDATTEAMVAALVAGGVPLESGGGHHGSPLAAAVADGEEGLPRVRGLIAAGADVNAVPSWGKPVFHHAVGNGRHPETLRLLIAAGADPYALDDSGVNAFHSAIGVDDEGAKEDSIRDTFGYLLALGLDLEHRNEGGDTPLAYAMTEGSALEVRVLCELGADPNAIAPLNRIASDGGGETVDLPLLFHAAYANGYETDGKTEALLRAGADPIATDPQGFAPLQLSLAMLCSEANAPEGEEGEPGEGDGAFGAAYREFLVGLAAFWADADTSPAGRNAFADRMVPPLRAHVAAFAARIPVWYRPGSEFSRRQREAQIACLAHLAAHDAWVRSGIGDELRGEGEA